MEFRGHNWNSGDTILISRVLLTLRGRAGRFVTWHDWREFLTEALTADEAALLRRHERTGRPLGETPFLDRIERTLHRVVRLAKRGRKPTRK